MKRQILSGCLLAVFLVPPLVASPPPTGASYRSGADIELVWIEPGEFQMGTPKDEFGSDYDPDEGPVHRVRITKGFYIGKYEVTQAQWEAVMGSNPSKFEKCGQSCPVEQVSWDDVQVFIQRLSQEENAGVYRLPREAEWEYAARAGDTRAGNGNWAEISWTYDNSGKRTHPVGQKKPNAWGLFDMLGNVSELVQDWAGDYKRGLQVDPQGPSKESARVKAGPFKGALFHMSRGGNYQFSAYGCRSSARGRTNRPDSGTGLRLVLVPSLGR